MKITIFTILPEIYDNFFQTSILKRAIQTGIIAVNIVDIKAYGIGNYHQVDDYSFGGGGMVLRPDVLSNCLEKNIDTQTLRTDDESELILTSPRGKVFNQKNAEYIAINVKNLYIICNRFEGVDQRIIDFYNIEEVSIGNFITLGGEIPSMAIIESTVRLINGVLGNAETIKEESFSDALNGMLEYDHYTRPRVWNHLDVPEVLLSGNHKEIQQWRLANSIAKTARKLDNNSTNQCDSQ